MADEKQKPEETCAWVLSRCSVDDVWYCQTHNYTDADAELNTPPEACLKARLAKAEADRAALTGDSEMLMEILSAIGFRDGGEDPIAFARELVAEAERLREALVEETARRMHEEPHCWPGPPYWIDETEAAKDKWREKARAALKEAKPDG